MFDHAYAKLISDAHCYNDVTTKWVGGKAVSINGKPVEVRSLNVDRIDGDMLTVSRTLREVPDH